MRLFVVEIPKMYDREKLRGCVATPISILARKLFARETKLLRIHISITERGGHGTDRQNEWHHDLFNR